MSKSRSLYDNPYKYACVCSVPLKLAKIACKKQRHLEKEQKKHQAMLSTLECGDCVLTTSGFYGIVIDITDDTVIVEFGNNKNCRIPMQKSAITQIEKADAE